MNKDNHVTVQIQNILLAEDNYRFEPQKDQNAAYLEMMTKEGEKVLKLAESICESPLGHELMVVKETETTGVYVAAEGNRRLSALMTLKAPELLKAINPKLMAKFKALDASLIPDEIVVCVENDEEKIRKILRLKHNGEEDGAGTVQWDADMKARYRQAIGVGDKVQDFLDELVKNSILTKNEAHVDVTRTNWERLLNSLEGREYLGLKMDGGKIVDDPAFAKKLQIDRIKKVASGLKGQKVAVVYKKEERIKFLKSIDAGFAPTVTATGKGAPVPIPIIAATATTAATTTSLPTSSTPSATPPKYKFSILKITTIDSNNADNWGIFSTLSELKKMCTAEKSNYPCEKYPVATTFLIRSLLEQSLKYWLKNKYPKDWNDVHSGNLSTILPMQKFIDHYLYKISSGQVFFDKTTDGIFADFFGKKGTHKNILNILVHYPMLITKPIDAAGTAFEIYTFANSFVFDIINFVLNN